MLDNVLADAGMCRVQMHSMVLEEPKNALQFGVHVFERVPAVWVRHEFRGIQKVVAYFHNRMYCDGIVVERQIPVQYLLRHFAEFGFHGNREISCNALFALSWGCPGE